MMPHATGCSASIPRGFAQCDGCYALLALCHGAARTCMRLHRSNLRCAHCWRSGALEHRYVLDGRVAIWAVSGFFIWA